MAVLKVIMAKTDLLHRLEVVQNVKLYLITALINLVTFTVGTALSWPSPSIPKLLSIDPAINPLENPIRHSEAGWVASILLLGIALGPWTTGFLSDKIGRKHTLILFVIPVMIGFIIKAFANTIMLLYVARFLCGLSGGAVFSLVPIYIGEIAQDSNRGSLGFFLVIFLCFGNFFIYCTGPYMTIQTLSYLCLVAPFIFLVLVKLLPESPIYLLSKNKYDEAEIALTNLRPANTSADVIKAELKQLKAHVDSAHADSQNSYGSIFKTKASRKALIIGVVLVQFQQFSGVFAFISYMEVIFQSTGSAIPSDISAIIIGLVQIFSCVLGAAVVDRYGRKTLLIESAIGMALAQLGIGTYFFLKSMESGLAETFYWLPIVSLVLFMISFNPGFGSIPWMLLGEIFTPNVRGFGSSLTTSLGFVAAFGITTIFPILVEAVGNAYAFWFFALCCVLGLFFTLAYIPETKGKSLEEIQVILAK